MSKFTLKLVQLTALILAPLVSYGENIRYELNETNPGYAALTLKSDQIQNKINVSVSHDEKTISVISPRGSFDGTRKFGAEGIIRKLEQIRSEETSTLLLLFKDKVKVRGEAGARSARIIAYSDPDSEVRAAPNLNLVFAEHVNQIGRTSGITVVIPNIERPGLTWASSNLRMVAYFIDLAAFWPLAPWIKNNPRESELEGLVKGLNNEVIELRNNNMVMEEELRKKGVGK